MDKDRVIVFWSEKKRNMCFIREDYPFLYVPKKKIRKKIGKQVVEKIIKSKDYLPILFYYTQRQHKNLFQCINEKKEFEKILRNIGRMKKLRWYDILL